MPSSVVEHGFVVGGGDVVVGGGGGVVVGGRVCVVGSGLRRVVGRVVVGRDVVVVVVVRRVVVGGVRDVDDAGVVVVLGGDSTIDGSVVVAAVTARSAASPLTLPASQNDVAIAVVAMAPMTTGFARDGVAARCRPAMPSVTLRSESERENLWWSCAPTPQEAARLRKGHERVTTV